jgi:hypothetical protein
MAVRLSDVGLASTVLVSIGIAKTALSRELDQA